MTRKSLIERMKNKPVAIFAIAIVTAVTLGYPVLNYFNEQTVKRLENDCSLEIKQLNARLSSFHRGLIDTNWFQTRTLFVHKGSQTSVPSTSIFFEDGEFYADSSLPDFTYSYTTELGLTKLLIDSSFLIDYPNQVSMEQSFMHLWKSTKSVDIKGNEYVKSVFQYMYVEKISNDEIKQRFQLSAVSDSDSSIGDSMYNYASARNPISDTLDRLNFYFKGDIIAAYLTGILGSQLALEKTSNIKFDITDVQKVNNLLYLSEETILKDIVIPGHSGSKIYLIKEIMLASLSNGIYIIQTCTPSFTPMLNQEDSATINKWLAGIKILYE